jgi:hypothetical protein
VRGVVVVCALLVLYKAFFAAPVDFPVNKIIFIAKFIVSTCFLQESQVHFDKGI